MVGVDYPGAFVVPCVVAIEDENLHRSHFWVRDHATEGLRPLGKYLDSLPQIREIQDYLVERARRYDVPVIYNDSLDVAIGEVLDLVLRRADQLAGVA
jgi:2-phosphoglycerate kinase